MKNKKIIISIIAVILIVIAVIGGTYAYWHWQTTAEENTSFNLVIPKPSDLFSCSADGGGNINANEKTLVPTVVNSSTTENYIKRAVKVSPTISADNTTVYLSLWLNVNVIGSGLSKTDNLHYVLTTGASSPDDGVILSKNFKGVSVNDKLYLLSDKTYSATTTETYYLWIWLDAKETADSSMNQSLELSLAGECKDNIN